MANFEIAHKVTADCEGGYVNDKNDSGGETIFGIARNMWKDLPLWKIVDDYKKMVGDLSQKAERKELEKLCLGNAEFVAQKNAFYKAQFWDKIKGDEITSQAVAGNVYDFAVNAGVKQAVKTLQRALGVSDDGIFGNGTLTACNNAESANLNNDYCVGRENFYKDLVKRKPQNEKFLNGWLGRVKRFYV
ncbi:Predicted Peptidoglycan domain [Helicobacter cinaedi]|uniref:Predicted Peptidoglycan domain n=1 Tax=Helicobacter cinaedi TaxID=213 RepID=A0A377JX60_9HELI|nr:glycosyl hydrolase 108 family protein [Helicobacter cinaedi]STP14286.1 Predicted Peptidoglycan domain [Helicobacter cinaedi]